MQEKGAAAGIYRPEIDGLRALAVTGVVGYHLGLGLPGGFVGVDVFFVISGYLITSLLVRDFHSGTFSWAGFFERRMRRILPALIFVSLVVLAAGACWLMPKDFESLGKTAVAQAVMASNVYLWKNGGYFDGSLDANPLMHCWSLAVEEQFYLLYPLLLMGLCWMTATRGRRRSGPVLASIFSGSLLASVLLIRANKDPSAFYLLPARAWEFLAGGLLVFLPPVLGAVSGWLRACWAWAGLAAVVLPLFCYSEQTRFPGVAALAPCLGTALLLACFKPDAAGASRDTFLVRLLSWRPLVFVGLVSYSWYLWHWPVWVFASYWSSKGQLPVDQRVAAVLVSFGLAVVTWKLVETPFRKRRVIPSRRFFLTAAVLASLLLLTAGGIVVICKGLPSRWPEQVVKNDEAVRDVGPVPQMELHHLQADALYRLGDVTTGQKPAVLVWGDSHAMHVLPALDDLCKELGLMAVAATHSSTPPLVDAVFQMPAGRRGLNEQTPVFAREVIGYMARHQIRHVILAASWSGYQVMDPGLLERALAHTVRTLAEAGCKVTVFMDVPNHDKDVPKSLVRRWLSGTHDLSWISTREKHQAANAVLYRLAEQGLPARFLDLSLPFETDGSERYRVEQDGVALYRDKGHLSSRGSRLVVLPFLRQNLADALKDD